MASLDQLERALRNADAAGDTEAATFLAAEIRRAQTESERPTASGSFLPFSRMADGSLQFDSDAGIVGDIKRAFMLPGDVAAGRTKVIDPETGDVSEEVIQRSLDTAALASPINPGVRAGDKFIPGVSRTLRKKKVDPPSAKELLRQGGRGFDAMRATGAEYPASEVKALAEALMIRLNEKGLDDVTAPKTFRTLSKLANPPEGATATISGLHSARKTFGKIRQNFNEPSDQGAAGDAISALDEFISRPPVSAGPAADARRRAGSLLQRANADYAAGKRSDLINGIERSADLRASAANSGQNTGNAIRQRVASALLKEKDTAGFNPAEKELLEGVVEGSSAANRTRDLGNRLGGGGGLGATVTGGLGAGVGSMFGMPVEGAMLGAGSLVAAGGALKKASNNLTRGALRRADEQVRKRSPLYEYRLRQAPLEVSSTPMQQALIRYLLLAPDAPQ